MDLRSLQQDRSSIMPWHGAAGRGRVRRVLAACAAVAALTLPACAEELSLDVEHRWLPRDLHASCARRTSACVAADNTRKELPDVGQVRRRNLGIIVGGAAAVGLYGRQNWWQDGFAGRFRTFNEGWFEQNTYSGGSDKLGHFFMNYAGTRLMSKAFFSAGNDPDTSLALAAWTTLGTFTAIEVLDGFSRAWRFSKEDAIMNAAGAGAAILFEKYPMLDRLFDLRILYQPSSEGGRRFKPFSDYSGQTYLVVTKASGVAALREHPVLRFLELAVGYRARGYSEVSGQLVQAGTRQVYVGISLNVAELLGQTVFRRSTGGSRVQAVSDTVLEYVQIPGTTAMGSHSLSAQ